ncbi:MAG: Asp-tRNA(Asn)/Glu-tRNA(Gln) amidotransferase subunit GatC [Erysipelotrichales bacterium]
MTNEEVKGYLNTLYLEADGEDLEYITSEVNRSIEVLNLLDEFDTSNIEPTTWGCYQETDILREDVVDHTISSEDALKNAADTQDGYVKYVKVV